MMPICSSSMPEEAHVDPKTGELNVLEWSKRSFYHDGISSPSEILRYVSIKHVALELQEPNLKPAYIGRI